MITNNQTNGAEIKSSAINTQKDIVIATAM